MVDRLFLSDELNSIDLILTDGKSQVSDCLIHRTLYGFSSTSADDVETFGKDVIENTAGVCPLRSLPNDGGNTDYRRIMDKTSTTCTGTIICTTILSSDKKETPFVRACNSPSNLLRGDGNEEITPIKINQNRCESTAIVTNVTMGVRACDSDKTCVKENRHFLSKDIKLPQKNVTGTTDYFLDLDLDAQTTVDEEGRQALASDKPIRFGFSHHIISLTITSAAYDVIVDAAKFSGRSHMPSYTNMLLEMGDTSAVEESSNLEVEIFDKGMANSLVEYDNSGSGNNDTESNSGLLVQSDKIEVEDLDDNLDKLDAETGHSIDNHVTIVDKEPIDIPSAEDIIFTKTKSTGFIIDPEKDETVIVEKFMPCLRDDSHINKKDITLLSYEVVNMSHKIVNQKLVHKTIATVLCSEQLIDVLQNHSLDGNRENLLNMLRTPQLSSLKIDTFAKRQNYLNSVDKLNSPMKLPAAGEGCDPLLDIECDQNIDEVFMAKDYIAITEKSSINERAFVRESIITETTKAAYCLSSLNKAEKLQSTIFATAAIKITADDRSLFHRDTIEIQQQSGKDSTLNPMIHEQSYSKLQKGKISLFNRFFGQKDMCSILAGDESILPTCCTGVSISGACYNSYAEDSY